MDDIFKRLGIVESMVADIRVQVAGILAVLPYLATKADLKDEIGAVRRDMNDKLGDMDDRLGGLRNDMNDKLGDLRSDMHAMESRLISHDKWMMRWLVGTMISTIASVFAIVKYFT